jgi:hypothetical protein
MKKSIGAVLSISITAGLLAACGGNSSSSAPPGTGTFCGSAPNQMEVLYPKPGSKSVNPALTSIYVSTKGQLPPSNSFNFFLAQSNGGQTFTSPFFGVSESSIPTPHAKPTYSNPVYYATSLPPSYVIGPAQVVSLLWNDGGTGCSPHTTVATFTTKGGSSQ